MDSTQDHHLIGIVFYPNRLRQATAPILRARITRKPRTHPALTVHIRARFRSPSRPNCIHLRSPTDGSAD